jgi:hypothetical protein
LTIQRNYIRDVERFAVFLRRSPDTASTEDVRRFNLPRAKPAFPCQP